MSQENKVLVFGGCFCPPHRGHYQQVAKRCSEYKHVYVYIYKKSRYHFNPTDSLKLWNLYLENDLNCNVTVRVCPNISKQHPAKQGILDLLQNNEVDPGTTFDVVIGDDPDNDYKDKTDMDIREGVTATFIKDFREEKSISSSAIVKHLHQNDITIRYLLGIVPEHVPLQNIYNIKRVLSAWKKSVFQESSKKRRARVDKKHATTSSTVNKKLMF